MNIVMNPPLPPPQDIYNEGPIERVFDNGVVGNYRGLPNYNDEPTDYEYRVQELIDDACDYEESVLAPAREENLQYFYGEIPGPEEGQSSAVSTDYRDTVMAILPSMIRIFCGDENVVYCVPNYEGQEDAAKQCSDYLVYVFMDDNPGFLILHDIIKDALRCKIGVTTWWTENYTEMKQETYRNITTEQLQYLIYENETLEVVDIQNSEMYPEVMIDEVTVRFQKVKPVQHVESVPLEEFRIDRRSKTIKTAPLVGWDRIVQVSDLIEMGYEWDELEPFLNATSTYAADRYYRNPGIDEINPQGDLDIRYGCYFIRIDKDGDGIAELREIHTVGDTHHIIYDEMVSHVNFAGWCPDPEPHTVVGDTPAELVKDIQRIKTNMVRGALDSLAASIWPRIVFNETLTNADDVLNEEIGAAIRTKGEPMATVHELAHQFVGQPVFTMFDVMERLRQQRTGISDASKGLDPKALQSTALQGVDAIVAGAQERIELCARILAATGMKEMFEGLLREIVNNPAPERVVQLRGKWVNINPSTFDPNMKLKVNPTLGKGADMTRLMALQEVKQTQIMAMEKFGPVNPLCGPEEFRNTLEDMLAIVNIKNVGRYYKVITPEMVEQIAATPKEPDPAMVLAQAEMEKTRAKMAGEIAKSDREDRKMRMDDDFRRDELTVTSILNAAKIEAEWQYDVNEQALAAANMANEGANADREFESEQAAAV